MKYLKCQVILCNNICDLPIMDTAERLFTGDVVHEDEAHGAAVVGRGDGSVPLLARSVLRQRENESWIF